MSQGVSKTEFQRNSDFNIDGRGETVITLRRAKEELKRLLSFALMTFLPILSIILGTAPGAYQRR
jgi:hypothetical protein